MIHPRGFTVLVKPKDAEEEIKEQTKTSLIHIPDFVKDQERVNVHEGVVVSIGNCAWHGLGSGARWCNEGDRILYAQFGGKFVKDKDGTEYVLIQDKDVMAVLGD